MKKQKIVINSGTYELWRDIENAFLTQHYTQMYTFCKHIIKKQKMKGGNIEPRDYIYYYQVATRDKNGQMFRKNNKMNNRYTMHEYLGSFNNFRQTHESLMAQLFDAGTIKTLDRGVFEIDRHIIEVLKQKAPKSFETPSVKKLMKLLGE